MKRRRRDRQDRSRALHSFHGDGETPPTCAAAVDVGGPCSRGPRCPTPPRGVRRHISHSSSLGFSSSASVTGRMRSASCARRGGPAVMAKAATIPHVASAERNTNHGRSDRSMTPPLRSREPWRRVLPARNPVRLGPGRQSGSAGDSDEVAERRKVVRPHCRRPDDTGGERRNSVNAGSRGRRRTGTGRPCTPARTVPSPPIRWSRGRPGSRRTRRLELRTCPVGVPP